VDWQFFFEPTVQLVLATALLAILIVIGIYVLMRVRAEAREDPTSPSELLSQFEELRARGMLQEEEFKKIKDNLSKKLRDQLKPSSEAE